MEWFTEVENILALSFGGVSLGAVITTIVILVKQWIANKAQGSKYEAFFKEAQKGYEQMKGLYEQEKAKLAEKDVETVLLQQTQNVMLDALIKISLASKMDSDDKASIVANIEKLKLIAPKELIEEVKTKTENIITNVSAEIVDSPAQTAVNVIQSAATLLDKYSNKE